ncbi:S-adenosyl-L-methionine-dependent methyltransferase [Aspergillus venezuelensis]
MASQTTTPLPNPGTAAAAFDQASDVYERLTGGCTRELAEYLLTLEPKPSSSSVVLDNACGTGILSSEVLRRFESGGSKPRLFAADLAPSMVDKFRARAEINGWLSEENNKLEISVMDAKTLTYPDDTFTHSYTNLGFPFFPNGEKAAREVYRTLKSGGTAFVTTWKSLGYLSHIQRAQLAVRPGSTPWETPMPKEWYTREMLVGTLQAGEFRNDQILVQEKMVRLRGADVDDLVDILKAGFLAQVTNGWCESEKDRWVNELRNGLSSHEQETASLEMVAWVARAQK